MKGTGKAIGYWPSSTCRAPLRNAGFACGVTDATDVRVTKRGEYSLACSNQLVPECLQHRMANGYDPVGSSYSPSVTGAALAYVDCITTWLVKSDECAYVCDHAYGRFVEFVENMKRTSVGQDGEVRRAGPRDRRYSPPVLTTPHRFGQAGCQGVRWFNSARCMHENAPCLSPSSLFQIPVLTDA